MTNLRSIFGIDERAPLRIIGLPFLETIEPTDDDAVDALRRLVLSSTTVFDALMDRAWVEGSIGETEISVIRDIGRITEDDEDAALRVIAMPFLETIEPADGVTLGALRGLTSTGVLDVLLNRPWVGDGLSDPELRIVTDLRSIFGIDERAPLRIIGLPFLETVEPTDVVAVDTLGRLAHSSAAVFDALMDRPWVEGSIGETEISVIGDILWITGNDEDATLRIIAMPFLETVEPTDVVAVDTLGRLAHSSAAVFDALMDRPWVEGSIGETEISVIGDILWITGNDEDATLRIIAMPFLETIEPGDGAAVSALGRLALSSTTVFGALMDRPWVEGSIGETEISVIGDIGWITDNDEDAALRVIGLPFLETIEPGDGAAVSALGRLAHSSTTVFDALMDRPWVEGSIGETEISVIGDIGWITDNDEDAALRLIAMPFLETIEPGDGAAVSALGRLALSSTTVFGALMDRPWVEGSIGETEISVIGDIGWITDNDEDAALRLIAMPFLETIEPGDGAAVSALGRLASNNPQVLQQIMAHPSLSGGITDEWAKAATGGGPCSRHQPGPHRSPAGTRRNSDRRAAHRPAARRRGALDHHRHRPATGERHGRLGARRPEC